jgi:AraC-like DNA-binding protein
VQQLEKHNSLEPYVKDIYLLESKDDKAENNLPFFADGYPGIVYTESIHPFYLKPKNKRLSDFYLFGQTIEPITLSTKGSFKLMSLILYPFAVRMLLGVNPKLLNDDCFDLNEVNIIDTASTVARIRKTESVSEKLGLIAEYLNGLVKLASTNTDNCIKLALNLIIRTKGRASIREVYKQLFITERTFERRFMNEIGISPKQFASIIQFSSSMRKLSENEFSILTDVGLESGYADQSHFIRTFKKYAGKTPSEFLRSNRI